MFIDLILSKLPSTPTFQQIFGKLGFDECYFIQNNDWLSLSDKNTDNAIIIDIINNQDKKWQYHLSIYINKKIENEKLFYFSTAKQIAQISNYDVICCYYDNDIINSPIKNNPFYDFAYIDNHWYLIDDVNADYANDELKSGDIKIIKSIDKEMAYFLEFGEYFRDIK